LCSSRKIINGKGRQKRTEQKKPFNTKLKKNGIITRNKLVMKKINEKSQRNPTLWYEQYKTQM
jgi:hypothetical protein